MSRGVYVPKDVELVIYFPMPDEETLYEIDMLLDDLKYYLQSKMPSLEETEDWVGREGYIFLENNFIRVGISEYAGVIAVWILVKEGENFAYKWLSKVKKHFYNLPVENKLELLGHFSNGEPIYRRVE